MKEIRKAVIPVAGMGTRLLPVTKSQPKEMLPLGRKPCVQYIVEELAGEGLEEILFITGSNKRSIEDHFDTDELLRGKLQNAGQSAQLDSLRFEELNIGIYYTRQKRAAGLGDAISYARGFVGDEPFVVALGDAVIESEGEDPLLRRMIRLFQEKEPAFVVAVREVRPEDVSKYGILELAERGELLEIKDIVEKPARHEAPSNYAVAARYIFKPEIFAFLEKTLPGTGGEIQLTDAMRMMLKHGYKAYAVPLLKGEYRHDLGSFESYYKSFIHFALKDKEYGYRVRQYIQAICDDQEEGGW